MKRCFSVLFAVFLLSSSYGHADQPSDRPVGPPGDGNGSGFDEYISQFDYADRKLMKCDSDCIIEGICAGTMQLVDIRFPEEREAWQINFGDHIPLPELPNRLRELDPSKVIVTICPHSARSNLARAYLVSAGFDPDTTKFATEGLLGLEEALRGDNARDFVNECLNR
ncbi:MAG: rhodanese-like domain-containing protein [Anaerolineales bacterium]|jgi:rhodanese-related sulfurtransferase